MDKKDIIRQIEFSTLRHYNLWTIGITDDQARRCQEHGNPKNWLPWTAKSEKDTRDIEKYFIDKGMKGDTGGGKNPKYVYIF